MKAEDLLIVIPMAGFSSRFFEAGYSVPKYMLECNNKSLFEIAVSSFSKYYESAFFVFVVRDDEFNAKNFVENAAIRMGIKHYFIHILSITTRGQAETVYLSLADIEYKKSLLIFNIDTYRPNFEIPKIVPHCDGYLEVFRGEGEHWSFVERASNQSCEVLRTTEKQRISDLCSTGLYFFKSIEDFKDSFLHSVESNALVKNEYYVAPLYNYLIKNGKKIVFEQICDDEVYFFGTPTEYNIFCNKVF